MSTMLEMRVIEERLWMFGRRVVATLSLYRTRSEAVALTMTWGVVLAF